MQLPPEQRAETFLGVDAARVLELLAVEMRTHWPLVARRRNRAANQKTAARQQNEQRDYSQKYAALGHGWSDEIL